MATIAKSISVIIPAYGHCPELIEVVAAILSGTLAPAEVIVSHSGPDDPTMPLMARFPDLTILHEPERLFAGAARNRGAAVACGEILAFCDADTRPAEDWLAQLAGALVPDRKRIAVGAVGMARQGGYWGMTNWLLEFSEQAPWRPAQSQTGGASCNMALHGEAFRAVGGFREDLRGGEDTTLFADLRHSGLEQIFCPGARVHHYNNPGFHAFVRHQTGLGKSFAQVRTDRNMPGSFWVRRPPLTLALWLPKTFLVLRRGLLGGVRPFVFTLYLAPGVLVGGVIWSLACLREARILARGPVSGAVTDDVANRQEQDDS